MYHDKRFQLDISFPFVAFSHEQIKSATTSGFLLAETACARGPLLCMSCPSSYELKCLVLFSSSQLPVLLEGIQTL
jgi:hypothetical protein